MCKKFVKKAMLTDSKLMAMLSKYPDAIDSIHFSDQYTVSIKINAYF